MPFPPHVGLSYSKVRKATQTFGAVQTYGFAPHVSNAFLKPFHGIQSEHRVPNSSVFATRHPFAGEGISSPMRTAPRKSCGNCKAKWGMKTAENGGLPRLSRQCNGASGTFEQGNPASSIPAACTGPGVAASADQSAGRFAFSAARKGKLQPPRENDTNSAWLTPFVVRRRRTRSPVAAAISADWATSFASGVPSGNREKSIGLLEPRALRGRSKARSLSVIGPAPKPHTPRGEVQIGSRWKSAGRPPEAKNQ
jgi:hypothetical protein